MKSHQYQSNERKKTKGYSWMNMIWKSSLVVWRFRLFSPSNTKRNRLIEDSSVFCLKIFLSITSYIRLSNKKHVIKYLLNIDSAVFLFFREQSKNTWRWRLSVFINELDIFNKKYLRHYPLFICIGISYLFPSH